MMSTSPLGAFTTSPCGTRYRPASYSGVVVGRSRSFAGPGVQTLPIWIFNNYQRPNQLPLVNVAAVLVLLLSIIPVYVASRLTEDPASVAGART